MCHKMLFLPSRKQSTTRKSKRGNAKVYTNFVQIFSVQQAYEAGV